MIVIYRIESFTGNYQAGAEFRLAAEFDKIATVDLFKAGSKRYYRLGFTSDPTAAELLQIEAQLLPNVVVTRQSTEKFEYYFQKQKRPLGKGNKLFEKKAFDRTKDQARIDKIKKQKKES